MGFIRKSRCETLGAEARCILDVAMTTLLGLGFAIMQAEIGEVEQAADGSMLPILRLLSHDLIVAVIKLFARDGEGELELPQHLKLELVELL